MKIKITLIVSFLCGILLLGYQQLHKQLLWAQESDLQAQQQKQAAQKSWQEPLYSKAHADSLPSTILLQGNYAFSLDSFSLSYECQSLSDLDTLAELPFISYLDETFHMGLSDFIKDSMNAPKASKIFFKHQVAASLIFPDKSENAKPNACKLELFIFPEADPTVQDIPFLSAFDQDDYIIRTPIISQDQTILLCQTPPFIFNSLYAKNDASPAAISYELHTKDTKLTKIKVLVGYRGRSKLSADCFVPLQHLIDNSWMCAPQDLIKLHDIENALLSQPRQKGSGHTASFHYAYRFIDPAIDEKDRLSHYFELTLYQ